MITVSLKLAFGNGFDLAWSKKNWQLTWTKADSGEGKTHTQSKKNDACNRFGTYQKGTFHPSTEEKHPRSAGKQRNIRKGFGNSSRNTTTRKFERKLPEYSFLLNNQKTLKPERFRSIPYLTFRLCGECIQNMGLDCDFRSVGSKAGLQNALPRETLAPTWNLMRSQDKSWVPVVVTGTLSPGRTLGLKKDLPDNHAELKL